MALTARLFVPEDMLVLDVQQSQLLDIPAGQRLEYAERLANGGSAFTLWDRRDSAMVVMACCGAIRVHPGYAQLWALFSRHMPRVPVAMTHIVRRYIGSLTEARVDCHVSAANAGACGWARLIGMTEEARLRGAMPDGSDMLIFTRSAR